MGGILKVLARFHRMANLDFDYILIRDSDFRNGTLTNCVFGETTRIVSGKFGGTTLEKCKLRGSFSGCNFNSSFWDTVCAHDSRFEDCLFINVRFSNCYLRSTHFENCIFHGCSFFDCDLSQAHFSRSSSIVKSTFRRCDFDQVHLPDAFIPDVINESKSVPYIPMACPESGPIIGYKKATASHPLRGWTDVIVKLEIPEDAKRSSALGRKCRCDKAKVLGIYAIDLFRKLVGGVHENGAVDTVLSYHIGDKMSDDTVAYSKFAFIPGSGSEPFPYKVGQWVEPDKWDDDRFNECSHGIHFFISAQEAVDY